MKETSAQQSLLRVLTCGSVDDGKSTLIGRLLYESKMIYEDQLTTLKSESKKFGTTNEEFDFALLVDGLSAEREQGITIDVAYRYFSTEHRKFIIIDAPGHEQYTRNMVTGASHADLAIVIIDARKGVLKQTRRHSYLVKLLGIKNVILAVNKMDLVDYRQDFFENIVEAYQEVAASIGLKNIKAIPISALHGDNILTASKNMPWFFETNLMRYLNYVETEKATKNMLFRMPVQWVNRASADFRGFAGQVMSGSIQYGDRIKALPSGKVATVKELVTYDGSLDIAGAGQSVTVVLDDAIDVSRGDVFCEVDKPAQVTEQFEALLVWMAEKPLVSGRQYWLQLGTAQALCTPSKPKYAIDMDTLEQIPAHHLKQNEIGCCNFALDRVVVFEPYDNNRYLGSFILVDRMSHETIAAGFIQHALRRSTNITQQSLLVNQAARSAIKSHKPAVLWLTGLSGAGKSTIANQVEVKLNQQGVHSTLLDGDNIRHGLNRDLSFTESDRAENIRRIAEVAKLMTEAGLITLVAFISPFAAERDMAKALIGSEQFFEIYINTTLEDAEKRDAKGLYKKARAGEIKNFTGINSPYEVPVNPDLMLDTTKLTSQEAADEIIQLLQNKNILF